MSSPKDIFTSLFKAIEAKDLSSLQKYLPSSGPLAVILSDGSVIDDAEDFIEFFEDWFGEDDWSINHEVAVVEETSEMAYGVFHGNYSGVDEEDGAYTIGLLTTCIIRKIDGKWLMVHFQQTEAMDEAEVLS